MKALKSTLFLVLVIFISGCATSVKTRIFTLGEPKLSATNKKVQLEISEVKLPSYLEGTPIVTRLNEFEIEKSRTNVWANPLREEIPLFLEKGFDQTLGTDSGKKLKLSLKILQLEPVKGKVMLNAKWRILNESNNLLKSGSKKLNTTVKSDKYSDIAAAQNALLSDLIKLITKELP